MSQVATVKKLDVKNARVKVTAYFREKGSVYQGTKDGECERFHMEFSIDSDENLANITELIRLGRQMCFTDDALTKVVTVTTDHLVNGQPLQLPA